MVDIPEYKIMVSEQDGNFIVCRKVPNDEYFWYYRKDNRIIKKDGEYWLRLDSVNVDDVLKDFIYNGAAHKRASPD